MMKRLSIITLMSVLVQQVAWANIVGTDLQNFNPNSNGLDFVTVQSTDTLDPFVFNFGAFLSYSTNSLPYFTLSTAPSGQNFLEPNDTVLANDLHLGVGLAKGWDIGVNASIIMDQSVDNSAFLGTFAETGLADLRVNSKFRLFKNDTSAFGINLSADFDRVINNPFIGDDAGPTFNAELLYDFMVTSWVRWGFNAGYRFRNPGTQIPNLSVVPLKDQVTYSTALAFMLSEWTIMAEVFGSSPLEDTTIPTDRKTGNLQALGGLRWRAHERFDIHGGVGTELFHGLGTPDIMAYMGFNWRLGSSGPRDKDSDGDGIFDSQDRCPNTPQSEIKEINEFGCSDSDKDGIFNDVDQCPQTPPETPVDNVGCKEKSNDDDGDGVPNSIDQCPGTPPGTVVNDLGCDVNRMEDIRLDNLNFVINKAELTAESQVRVGAMIEKLKNSGKPIQKLIVEGHTDSTGADQYNLDLSMRRAETIANLLESGVPFQPDQIQAVGIGEAKPIESNKTSRGRALNRRVELRVIH